MLVQRKPITDFDADHNDLSVHIPDVLIQHELPDGSLLTVSPCFPPLGPMSLSECVITPDDGDGYANMLMARQMASKDDMR